MLEHKGYGATGSAYFRFYDSRMAESVTLSGQVFTRTTKRVVDRVLRSFAHYTSDPVYYGDTDSCGMNLQPIVDKYFPKDWDQHKTAAALEKFVLEKVQPAVAAEFEKLLPKMGAVDMTIDYKLEQIASAAIHVAKKRYAQMVWRSEGVAYSKPKLKIMGIEAVRSSTPAVCRSLITDTIDLMLSRGLLATRNFIAEKYEWFKTLAPEQIAFPRGVNNLEKYIDRERIYRPNSACPKHVRAALLYNHYLKVHGIDKDFEEVFSGNKAKYVALRKPNPIYEDVIGFVDVLPKQFGLHKYVDYDAQWESAFLDPIKRLFDAAGWDIEERNTLFKFA